MFKEKSRKTRKLLITILMTTNYYNVVNWLAGLAQGWPYNRVRLFFDLVLLTFT